MTLRVLFVVCVTGLGSAEAASQSQFASVAGIAVDSVHGGYLQNAIVTVSAEKRTATTDSLGRFRIDSIQPGLHSLRLIHALLDTVGVGVVTAPIMLQAGEVKSFVLAIPSRLAIVAHKCSTKEMERGRAALAGSVVDADSQDPSVGATVVVAWTDIQLGAKTISRTPQRRTAKVKDDGSYLVCGIPDDLTTNVTAIRGSDSTASVPVAFNRLLALQSFSMPAISGDSTLTPNRSGGRGAIVRGKVLGPDNKSLSGARVSVEDDGVATTSDASGLFTLVGARSGTRELTVRKIGFQPVETAVELSSIHAREVVVQLKNTVKILEAVRISALREVGLERVGFADRKRLAVGKFFSPQDIESRNPLKLNYLLESAPMLRTGRTVDGKRYITGRTNGCVRYFVDGRLMMDAKNEADLDVLPDSYLSMAEIGAVEVYDPLMTPGEFMAYRSLLPCSIVLIWTKWKLGLR